MTRKPKLGECFAWEKKPWLVVPINEPHESKREFILYPWRQVYNHSDRIHIQMLYKMKENVQNATSVAVISRQNIFSVLKWVGISKPRYSR